MYWPSCTVHNGWSISNNEDFQLKDPYCTCFSRQDKSVQSSSLQNYPSHSCLLYFKDLKKGTGGKKPKRKRQRTEGNPVFYDLGHVNRKDGWLIIIILHDSCAPCSSPISTRKAKPVRKLVSQHAAAVCLGYKTLIFFPTLWYSVTGILTKIFTESTGVTAARAVSLNKKVNSIFTVFVWTFTFSERLKRKKKGKKTFFL